METRLEQKDRATGRTGRCLRVSNAQRGKEEDTGGAEEGGDTYRSNVLEKLEAVALGTKTEGSPERAAGTCIPWEERSRQGAQARAGRWMWRVELSSLTAPLGGGGVPAENRGGPDRLEEREKV